MRNHHSTSAFPAEEEYRVGPGPPPKEHQWKPGPNPLWGAPRIHGELLKRAVERRQVHGQAKRAAKPGMAQRAAKPGMAHLSA
jgi:hypothetical protein